MESKRLYTETLKDRLAILEYYERLVPSWIKTSLWLYSPTTADKQSQFFKILQERLTNAMSILKGGPSVSIETTKIFDQLAEKCKRFEAKIVTAENEFRDHYLVVFGYYKRLLPQWHETAVRLSLDEKKGEASADQQLNPLKDLQNQINEARFILKNTFVSSEQEQVVKIKELAESCEQLEALFTINAREDIERKKLTQEIKNSELNIGEALTEIRDICTYRPSRRGDKLVNLLLGLKLDTDRTRNKSSLPRQSQIDAGLVEWAQNQENLAISQNLEEIETWNIRRRKAIEAMAQSYKIEIEATRNCIAQIKNSEALKEIFKAWIKLLTLKIRRLGFSSGQGIVEINDPFPTTTTPVDDHKGTLVGSWKELDNELKELRNKKIKLEDELNWQKKSIAKQLYVLSVQIHRLKSKRVPLASRRAADNELKELSNKEKELREWRDYQEKTINKQLVALADQTERLEKRIQLADLEIKREALEFKLGLKPEGYDGRLFSGTGEQGALQELTKQIEKIKEEITLSRQSPMELAKFYSGR